MESIEDISSNIKTIQEKISALEKAIDKWKYNSNKRYPAVAFHVNDKFHKELLEIILDAFQKIDARLTNLELL